MTEPVKLGKYILYESLGRGGFGTIYRAEDTILQVERAIKILHPTLNADPQFIERFRLEARTAAQLDHPNIVPVYDLGQIEGSFYLVMRLMERGSLKDLLEKEGKFQADQALKLLEEVAAGLDFAHNSPDKLVHRDIKPGNILIDGTGRARVADLGFAKALQGASSASLSATGGMIGTPAYMAPELWRGEVVGPETDVYSLACMYFEMLTGQVLFTGDSPPEIMTKHVLDGPGLEEKWPVDLPERLRPVIQKGLATNPGDRYASAGAFARAARNALETTFSENEPAAKATVISEPTTEVKPEKAIETETEKKPAVQVGRPTKKAGPVQPAPKTEDTAKEPEQKRKLPTPILIGGGALIGILFCVLLAFGVFNWIDNLGTETEVPPKEVVLEVSPDDVLEVPITITPERGDESTVIEVPPDTSDVTTTAEIGSLDRPIRVVLIPLDNNDVVVEGGLIMLDTLTEITGFYFELLIPETNQQAITMFCESPEDTIGFLTGQNYVIANNLCGVLPTYRAVNFSSPIHWSAFVVRRDSGITSIEELDGATWAHPGEQSLLGYTVPRTMMAIAGVEPAFILEYRDFAEPLIALYKGEVDFATVYYQPYESDNGDWSEANPDVPLSVRRQCRPGRDLSQISCGSSGSLYVVKDARTLIQVDVPDVIENLSVLQISAGIPGDPFIIGTEMPANLRGFIEEAMIKFVQSDNWYFSVGHPDFYAWDILEFAEDHEYEIYRTISRNLGIGYDNIDDQ